MALKFKLASLDGLEEGVAALYKKTDDGYQLAIEGLPDVSGLEKKVQELLTEKKAESAKRKEAEEKAKADAEEAAKKAGDVEALEKSWSEKLTAKEAELMAQIASRDASLNKMLVDNVAQAIASEISTSPSLIMPHIKSRLAAEAKDGQHITRVLDASGKPSALTVDELKAEFVGNQAFAPIIIGSKASGGGAPNSGAGGNGGVKPGSMQDRAAQLIKSKSWD